MDFKKKHFVHEIEHFANARRYAFKQLFVKKNLCPPSASPCTSKKQKWHSYKHATAQPYLPETNRS